MQYLQFAFLTVLCWGTYGVCMHIGSSNMGDKENGRIMAFLWVGLAYFLTAVVAPLIILKLKGGNVAFWTFPTKGWQWSLIAGTLGALGALGVLLAFGMLFPNTLIYIYFALPIKAKYFVMIYGAFELWSGIQNNPGDNVAHFAHLGGMIFGYFLIKYWRKNSQHFY